MGPGPSLILGKKQSTEIRKPYRASKKPRPPHILHLKKHQEVEAIKEKMETGSKWYKKLKVQIPLVKIVLTCKYCYKLVACKL